MKIPIVPLGRRRIHLVVQKRYHTKTPVIPLGSDCQPAHILTTLNLRQASYPFDWLSTRSTVGLTYVNSNIKLKFERFLEEPRRNRRGHVFAEPYRATEFIHYGDLIENPETREMLSRRGRRFLDLFYSRGCSFLYAVLSRGLASPEDVKTFVESVDAFHKLARGRHKLLVYIRYDESTSENGPQCDEVYRALSEREHTRVVRYVRQRKTHGRWGDEREYVPLLTSLGLQLRPSLPRLFLEKEAEDGSAQP
jgi:Putative papain-like cysteine peptidase (DUF1796)